MGSPNQPFSLTRVLRRQEELEERDSLTRIDSLKRVSYGPPASASPRLADAWNLKDVKVGDKVEITYTEAVMISVK